MQSGSFFNFLMETQLKNEESSSGFIFPVTLKKVVDNKLINLN